MILIWCALRWLSQFLKDENLRQRLSDTSTFDQDFINNIALKYEAACQAGSDAANLYGVSAYYVSKLLLNGHTRLLAQKLANRPEGSKIYVNCVHPGLVDTDMLRALQDFLTPEAFAELLASGIHGKVVLSAEEAADTPVWLALLPPDGPSGLFWNDKKVISY